jgi:hypothetical protein
LTGGVSRTRLSRTGLARARLSRAALARAARRRATGAADRSGGARGSFRIGRVELFVPGTASQDNEDEHSRRRQPLRKRSVAHDLEFPEPSDRVRVLDRISRRASRTISLLSVSSCFQYLAHRRWS